MDERYRQDAAAGRADVAITAASDANQVTTAAVEGAAAADTGGTGEADACSFAASTPVATPSGERPIASLKVGDHVLAYNPTTGQRTTQTIVRVFLNHDHDRLDLTLALPSAHVALPPASATTASQSTQDAETARERARAGASGGWSRPARPTRCDRCHDGSSDQRHQRQLRHGRGDPHHGQPPLADDGSRLPGLPN